MRAKCFSESDRVLMIERVRANQTGIQNRSFKKAHVIEALKDPQVWLYVFIQIVYVNCSLSLALQLLTMCSITVFRSPQAVSGPSQRS